MKITTTAATSFVHGNRKYDVGDAVETTKGEADELEKAGLVTSGAPEAKVPTEQEIDPALLPTRGSEDEPLEAADMLGGDEEGQKQEAAPDNKMEDAPRNKASKPKAK